MQSTNTPRTQITHRKGRANLAATALALGIGTIVFASPAAARDEFKNAFEFELGRIVAHEVAAIGHAIVRPHGRVHHRPISAVVYEVPRHTVSHRVHRTYGPPAHARVHGHYKHHRSCRHKVSHYNRHDRWERRTVKRHARRDYRTEKRHHRQEKRADRRHERRDTRTHNRDYRRDTRIDNRDSRHGVRTSSDHDRRTHRSQSRRERRND